MLEAAPDAILTLDGHGRVLECNPAAERLFGYACAAMAGQDPVELIVPARLRDGYRRELRRYLDTGDGVLSGRHVEATVCRADGAEFPVALSLVHVPAEGPPLFTAYIRDITELKRTEDQLRQGARQLEVLSARLLEVQEAERRCLARELHDEIGQALTAAKITLELLRDRSAPEAPALTEVITLLGRVLSQVRALSLNLRPAVLDDLGLVPALRWYVHRRAARTGLSIRLDADPLAGRLPAPLETTCFRVVQEALTNVVRHARAHTVSVELRQRPQQLELVIRDDGQGFDVAAARQRAAAGESLGLLGMQERVQLAGGRLNIESAPGRGTQVRACFPQPPPDAGGNPHGSAPP